MEELILRIKPLTPIWTGDESRKCERLRETGIVGSLRWWYEALIRGLGGSACDPTNTKCDGEDHCDVCDLFGCTGWARKFRLDIESYGLTLIPEIGIGTREKRLIGGREKYLVRKVKGVMANEIILRFIPLKNITLSEWTLLNKAFEIIVNYGALGARTSQGNGVVEIIESNLPYGNGKLDSLALKGVNAGLPNLDKFFFFKFHIKFREDIGKLIEKEVFWTHSSDHGRFRDNWGVWKNLWYDFRFLPIAFHIRDGVRYLERNRSRRHAIFGAGGRRAQGSKIFVSHGYRVNDRVVEVRIWGYGVDDVVKRKVKESLEANLRKSLFSRGESEGLLDSCSLVCEISGREIWEGSI